MSPPRSSSPAPERRFFLAAPPFEAAGGARLLPEDEVHALRVLRVREGDRLVGLDGRGRAWPLVVGRVARGRDLELEVDGEPLEQPEPGTPGAGPRVEAWVSLPRGPRAEEMMSRATQLGLGALHPLVTARTPPGSGSRRERLERVAREALKQCGRLWLPSVSDPLPLAALTDLGADPCGPGLRLRLDPRAVERLGPLVEGRESGRRILLAVGPEGGFEPAEEAALEQAGFRGARLADAVLRIETALEAALAVIGERLLPPAP